MSETSLSRSLMESCICTRFIYPFTTTFLMFLVPPLRCILLAVTIFASLPKMLLSFPIKRSIPRAGKDLGTEQDKLQQSLFVIEESKPPPPISSNEEHLRGQSIVKRYSIDSEKQVESTSTTLADQNSDSVREYRSMLHWLQRLDSPFTEARISRIRDHTERVRRVIGRVVDMIQFKLHRSQSPTYQHWNHDFISGFVYPEEEDRNHRKELIRDSKKFLLRSAPYQRYSKITESLDLQESKRSLLQGNGHSNDYKGRSRTGSLPIKEAVEIPMLASEYQATKKRNDTTASNFSRMHRKLNHLQSGNRISIDEKAGWEKKSTDYIHSPEDEWTAPGDPRLLGPARAIFNYLKTMGVRSLAAAPCGTTRFWFPAVLKKLEKESFGFQFYCIDKDVSESEVREIRRAFSGLSSLKLGGFITTSSETMEDVMPRNLDVVISWFGIRSWGTRKSLRFVKGLRKSGTKRAIFASMCLNPDKTIDKPWIESESGVTSLWAHGVSGLRRSFNDCPQIIVYSLN